MTQYTFEQLDELSQEELEKIKVEKQEELYQVKQAKLTLISNILSLQGMIKREQSRG